MRWDEWVGSMDGRPTMWVKHLFCRWGCHIDLHKMVAADDPDCFHTHPAWAIRLVLWGGYVEQVDGPHPVGVCTLYQPKRRWWPGRIGVVSPRLCHRIERLFFGTSYSLWIRFRKVAKVEIRGDGWKRQERLYLQPDVIEAQP